MFTINRILRALLWLSLAGLLYGVGLGLRAILSLLVAST